MHFVVSVYMNQDNHLAIEEPEGNHSLLTVVRARVFARDGEVVPDGVRPLEVQAVVFDIAPTFRLVPGGHI